MNDPTPFDVWARDVVTNKPPVGAGVTAALDQWMAAVDDLATINGLDIDVPSALFALHAIYFLQSLTGGEPDPVHVMSYVGFLTYGYGTRYLDAQQ